MKKRKNTLYCVHTRHNFNNSSISLQVSFTFHKIFTKRPLFCILNIFLLIQTLIECRSKLHKSCWDIEMKSLMMSKTMIIFKCVSNLINTNIESQELEVFYKHKIHSYSCLFFFLRLFQRKNNYFKYLRWYLLKFIFPGIVRYV